MDPWTHRYQPQSTQDIVGQERAVAQLRDFILNFAKQKKKALLLTGPPGSGKSSCATAAARECDLELFEVNASDKRNKEHVEGIVGNALKQSSLFGRGKLILIDEVDGMSGTDDRGGIATLASLISNSPFPILMTANDGYSDKLKALRKECLVVAVEPLATEHMIAVLAKICRNEQVQCSEKLLTHIARQAQGDLRAAINDLEILGRYPQKIDDDNVLTLDAREKKESLVTALVKVIKNHDLSVAREAYRNVNEDLDEILLWLDENLAKEYQGKELMLAYEALSSADVFKGRIIRRQYWRYLTYIESLLSVAVAIAKDTSKKQFIRYERPQRGLSIWILKRKYDLRNSIAEKLARKTHGSLRSARQQLFYLKTVFEQEKHGNKRIGTEDSTESIGTTPAGAIAQELDLDEKEIEWLTSV